MKHGALWDLRNEPGIVSDLEKRAGRVKRSAESSGGRYRVESRQGDKNPQGRWRVSVTTDDFKARRVNAKRQSLLGALDSAR